MTMLVNKWTDGIDNQCQNLIAAMSALRIKDRNIDKDDGRSVLLISTNDSAVMDSMYKFNSILKEEGVQQTINPCITELYKSTIHVAKQTSTEMKLRCFYCQRVETEANINSIIKTVVVDWRVFMIRSEHEASDLEVDSETSWGCILVTEQMEDN